MSSTIILNNVKGMLLSYPDNYSDEGSLEVGGRTHTLSDSSQLGRLIETARNRGNLAVFICFAAASDAQVPEGMEWEEAAAQMADIDDEDSAILFAPFGMPRPGESRKDYQFREAVSRIVTVLAKTEGGPDLAELNGLLEAVHSLRTHIEIATQLASRLNLSAIYQNGNALSHLSDSDVYACRAASAIRAEIEVAKARAKAEKAAGV